MTIYAVPTTACSKPPSVNGASDAVCDMSLVNIFKDKEGAPSLTIS